MSAPENGDLLVAAAVRKEFGGLLAVKPEPKELPLIPASKTKRKAR